MRSHIRVVAGGTAVSIALVGFEAARVAVLSFRE